MNDRDCELLRRILEYVISSDATQQAKAEENRAKTPIAQVHTEDQAQTVRARINTRRSA